MLGNRESCANRIHKEHRELVVLIASVSTGEKLVSAYFIYAGQAHYNGWHQGTINFDTAFYYARNSYTDHQVGLDWVVNHSDP
jgi:hypothetical protein